MAKNRHLGRAGRLVTEFGVIVIGVFVALAAESWWSERADRRLEQVLRRDMVAEFAENIAILERDLATNAETAAHVTAFATMDDASLLAMTDELIVAQYGGFPEWAAFDPAMGYVQAIVGSGNLGAISDRQLRLRLSRWSGLLDEKQRFTLQTVNFQLAVLPAALAEISADRAWRPEERRRLQMLYRALDVLLRYVVRNQQRLIEEARAIHNYLRDDD